MSKLENLRHLVPSNGLNDATEQSSSTSSKRVEANRRNALRSTGPKSIRGKAISSRNSLKHGLLAKSIVIPSGPAKEDEKEFACLLSGLNDYFQPVGTVEELLVQEIVISYWRDRRAQLYEMGEILRQSHAVAFDELSKEADYDKISDRLGPDLTWTSLLTSSQGLEYVMEVLAEINGEVQTNEQISEESLQKLSRLCGGDWQQIVGKSEMLAELNREMKRLQGLQKKAKRLEADRLTAQLRRVLLLDPETMEPMLRYSIANERRRHRALAQLERLQRRRNGDVVPPPIDIQITGAPDDSSKRSQ